MKVTETAAKHVLVVIAVFFFLPTEFLIKLSSLIVFSFVDRDLGKSVQRRWRCMPLKTQFFAAAMVWKDLAMGWLLFS